MKISQFQNKNGGVKNQFLLSEEVRGANGNFIRRETYQSYNSIIAIRTIWNDRIDVELDERYWNYSRTTSKYRNIFLGETTKETKKKIDNGDYKLVNLNW